MQSGNSVDPDQMASSEASDRELHCLKKINPDQQANYKKKFKKQTFMDTTIVCLFDLILYVPSTIFQFDLILYVPSTIFQLNRDGSSWVGPVLS